MTRCHLIWISVEAKKRGEQLIVCALNTFKCSSHWLCCDRQACVWNWFSLCFIVKQKTLFIQLKMICSLVFPFLFISLVSAIQINNDCEELLLNQLCTVLHSENVTWCHETFVVPFYKKVSHFVFCSNFPWFCCTLFRCKKSFCKNKMSKNFPWFCVFLYGF